MLRIREHLTIRLPNGANERFKYLGVLIPNEDYGKTYFDLTKSPNPCLPKFRLIRAIVGDIHRTSVRLTSHYGCRGSWFESKWPYFNGRRCELLRLIGTVGSIPTRITRMGNWLTPCWCEPVTLPSHHISPLHFYTGSDYSRVCPK